MIAGGASVSIVAGVTTVAMGNGGYIETQGGIGYTCQAASGCRIEDGVVTRGAVVRGQRAAAPDLAVGPASASPASAAPGAQLGLSATVRNDGDGASAATTLRWYRSANATISRSDAEVGTDDVDALAAGGTSDESLGLQAPADAGTYHYGACADPVAGETDSGNNCSAAASVTITVRAAMASFALDADNGDPAGIAHAGGRLLVVDRTDDKVYAYSTTGQRDAAADFDLDAENDIPRGIAHAGGRVLVVDWRGRKVFAFSTTGQRDAAADFGLDAGNDNPTGIAHAGDRLYVVDVGDDKVYAYSTSGRRDAAADFDLGAGSGNASGIARAGDRLLVVDWLDRKVYAYWRNNGRADPASDFDLDSENRSAGGIAFAQSALYVVDGGSDAVYAYAGPAEPEGPDLIVEPPSASDANPHPGGSVALSATVRNRGNRQAGATTLRWYRSADAAISTSDTEVGAVPVGALAAGASQDAALSLSAPADLGDHFYGACADSAPGEPAAPNNCSGAVRVTVRAAMASFDLDADNGGPTGIARAGGRLLVVDWFDDKVYAYSTTGQRDAAADFDLDAENGSPRGIARAGDRLLVVDSIDDKVYAYSTTGQRDAAADFDLGAGNYTPTGIAHASGRLYVVDWNDDKVYAYSASGQRDAAADFDLGAGNGDPGGIARAGDRLLVVDSIDGKAYAYWWNNGLADPASDLGLDSENRSPGGIAFAQSALYVVDGGSDAVYAYAGPAEPDGPDLIVEPPSASDANPGAGNSVVFSATVRNRGNRQAGATTLRWYRSADDTISAFDAEVGADDVGALAAGASRDAALSLSAPADLGDYFYGACADSVPGEPAAPNNCSGAVRVTVRAAMASFALDAGNGYPTGIAHAGGRLLVVDRADDKVYAYSTTGQRDAAADFDLAAGNDGPAGIARAGDRLLVVDSLDDKVYAYSATGQRDAAADFELGDGNDFPEGIAHAGGRLLVVDRFDEKAYAYSAAGQRDEAADFDLGAGNGNPAGIARAGDRLYVADSFLHVTDSFDRKVYAYWRNNGLADPASDLGLDSRNRSAGGIAFAQSALYVVDGVSDAVYAYAGPAEPDGPDLIVEPPSVSDANPHPGGSVALSATVRNRGNGQADATTLRWYRSADLTVSAADTELGESALAGLPAGSTSRVSAELVVSADAGCYFCGACVDPVGGEGAVGNNCSRPVFVLVGARPDLDVTSAVLHASSSVAIDSDQPSRGTPILMTVTVANVGSGPSGAARLVFTGSGVGGEILEIPALDPGGTTTFSRVRAGYAQSGTRRYTACIEGVPCEAATANNCGPSRSTDY